MKTHKLSYKLGFEKVTRGLVAEKFQGTFLFCYYVGEVNGNQIEHIKTQQKNSSVLEGYVTR
jgi:hypothetical protein